MKVYVFCHIGAQKPNGGVKVLFEYAQALRNGGYDATILMPGAHLYPQDCPKGYKPSWFETDVPVFDDVRIVTKDDIVIIHEEAVWCYEHLAANNPRMIMLNQGLSSSLTNNVGKYISYNHVKNIYSNMLGVITISPYISEGVNKLFNVPKECIHHVENPIDDFFRPGQKTDKILIMNKQPDNVATTMIIKIILERYPGWEVKFVKDMTLEQVAYEMSTSKIFCFFCTPLGEGSSLPPMEAALSGCKVIGYSGVSSGYYYDEPLFTEIDYNDIVAFIDTMDKSVEMYKASNFENTWNTFHDTKAFANNMEELRKKRSKERFTNEVNRVFKELIGG